MCGAQTAELEALVDQQALTHIGYEKGQKGLEKAAQRSTWALQMMRQEVQGNSGKWQQEQREAQESSGMVWVLVLEEELEDY